jgi:hypothetical protein
VGSADVGFGAFQHERGDVHRGDPRAVTAGDLDGGGGYPAADVEYLAGRGDPSAGEQRPRGCPAARVDDSIANGGHELVRSRAATSLAAAFVAIVPPLPQADV